MFFLALFLLSSLLCVTQINSLPNEIQRCNLNDTDCLVSSANTVLQNSFGGNFNLGLESIDPMKIDSLIVEQKSGPVTVLAKLRDFEIVGFSKAKIYKFSGFEKNLIDLRMKIASATLIGPYHVNGLILILPINGAGKMKLNFKNFDIKMTLPVKRIEEGTKTFLQIDQPKMTFDITGGDVNLSHLGAFPNAFMNSNFNTIIYAIKSSISKSLVEKFAQKINSVFSVVSLADLFTD